MNPALSVEKEAALADRCGTYKFGILSNLLLLSNIFVNAISFMLTMVTGTVKSILHTNNLISSSH